MKVKSKEILELWRRLDIYELLRQKNKGKEKHIIYNLPDIADGGVRYEQLQNKVLKDTILKYRFMSGFDAYNVPSWDCHDRSIEKKVISKLSGRLDKINQLDFRNICREHALKSIEAQKLQLEQIGIFNRWSDAYLNMNMPTQGEIKLGEMFADLQEAGYIQKARKPVHWCIRCKNAMANIEMDFEVSKIKSAYVKFPVMNGLEEFGEDVYLLVMIIPLWSLTATVALVLNPSLDYLVVQGKDGVYVALEKSVNHIFSKFGNEKSKVLDRILGSKLNISNCSHPLTGKELPVFYSKIAASDSTTGCLYLIPGHNPRDYLFGLKNNLELYSVIDDDGKFTDEAEQLCGMEIFESDEVVSHELEKRNCLLFSELTDHLAPHCYQCGTPLVIRMIDQWFLNIEANDLKIRIEESLQDLNWSPESDKRNTIKRIKKSSDWCISCQRLWGLSVPIFYCERCGNQLSTSKGVKMSKETLNRFRAKSYLDLPWQPKPFQSFTTQEIVCSHCGAKEFRSDNSMLDSQFEFLMTYNVSLYNHNLKNLKGSSLTADLYLENQKLHRKWMPQLLFLSMAKRGYIPFKNVVTYPFTALSQKNGKLSEEFDSYMPNMLKRFHPDVLRAWLIESDESKDLKYLISQSEERYNFIKDVCFSMLKTIKQLKPSEQLRDISEKPEKPEKHKKHKKHKEQMLSRISDLDQLALNRLDKLSLEVIDNFKSNQVKEAYNLIYEFCSEIERLYIPNLKMDFWRHILTQLLKLIAPILPYTAEMIWQELSTNLKEKPSIFLNEWQMPDPNSIDEDAISNWRKAIKSKAEVTT